ncbi:MAG TPA: hydrogenase expression/formation protein HypE [Thermoanaerobaculia bacterium]|nr:hydrogenase expression/formation protein HypE [Thermoanaerobaculia bacterium]
MTVETPRARFQDRQIEMAHGAGGKASRRLVEGLIAARFGGGLSSALEDAAVLDLDGRRLAFTTDSFVVRPRRFPGGSIGSLAVHGTVNDLAMAGAQPLALLCSLIVEAGLPGKELEDEIDAMARAAEAAGAPIVGGDTKVVEHGKADGLYVNTAGIGLVDPRVRCDARSVQPGDQVLLSGPIGDHGVTILLARGDLDLDADLVSDTRSVAPLVAALLDACAEGVRWMRDPTRGGVATALNELARDAGVGVVIEEERVPLRDPVRGACELLGLDPLHIANEGQFVAVVAPEHADAALEAIRAAPGGERAARIGAVRADSAGAVVATTSYGGGRVVDMLVGDPLPRIC